MIELIALDVDRVPQCFGHCKIEIDRIKKRLIIILNNQKRRKTAYFEWKYQKEKNILFVYADDEMLDFALVFDKEIRCKKVFELVVEGKKAELVNLQLLEQRFLIPFLKTIDKLEKLKEIISNWIHRYEDNHKMRQLYDFVLVKCEQLKATKKAINVTESLNLLKRRHSSVESGIQSPEDFNDERSNSWCSDKVANKKRRLFFAPEYTMVLNPSDFKLVIFKLNTNFRRCLIVFSPIDKKYCYEFLWVASQKTFYCSGCRMKQKNNTAIMDLKGLENVAKLEEKEHDCEAILYEPEKYTEVEIVKKPTYEIFENCDESNSKYLIILSQEDRTQCLEYKWRYNQRRFECCTCKTAAARIWLNSGEEYVELYDVAQNPEHSCELQEYNPHKYSNIKQIVLYPNFELRINADEGVEKRTLIIFHPKNRNLCYYYSLHANNSEKYYCKGCNNQSRDSTAKIYQNSYGEDYVVLSNSEHVCSYRPYVQEQQRIILRPPAFEFLDSEHFQLPKLFIFDENDPDLCYVFTPYKQGNNCRYYCISCDYNKRKTSERPVVMMDGRECKGVVTAFVYKDEDDEIYVEMNENQQHLCKPKKYDPERYTIKQETIIESADFFLFNYYQKKSDILYAAIYEPGNQKKCRIFRCSKSSNIFVCVNCSMKRRYVSAVLYENPETQTEYFKVKQVQHVCTSRNVSTLKKAGITMLNESGLSLRKEKKKFVESRVVRFSDFELRDPEASDGKLIIFYDEEKELCYEYSYYSYKKEYRCLSCSRKGIIIKANLHTDETGDQFIHLGERTHECEPVKYEADITENLKTTNFIVLDNESDILTTQLVVFTSETKEECYIYRKHGNIFRCSECCKSKKSVSARLSQFEDGRDYVNLIKTDHICTPLKYDPTQMKSKVIPESEFKLFEGSRGHPNIFMVIFDPAKEGHVFEFKLKMKNTYSCINCMKQKQTVNAKLHENENGEKFVTLKKEHVCQSIKYDPDKYEHQKQIIYDGYVLLPSSKSDGKKLVVFDESEGKYRGYEYRFQRYCNTFLCAGCELTPVRAKLKIDDDGKECVEVGTRQHTCIPANFKYDNRIIESQDFNYLEDGAIGMNHPTNSSLCYEMNYDEKMEAYVCLKCKEKNRCITAIVYDDNCGEEFLLLNNCHVCSAIVKFSEF